jgi:hypothetical protein
VEGSQVPAEDLPIGVVKKRNEGMLRVWKQVGQDSIMLESWRDYAGS